MFFLSCRIRTSVGPLAGSKPRLSTGIDALDRPRTSVVAGAVTQARSAGSGFGADVTRRTRYSRVRLIHLWAVRAATRKPSWLRYIDCLGWKFSQPSRIQATRRWYIVGSAGLAPPEATPCGSTLTRSCLPPSDPTFPAGALSSFSVPAARCRSNTSRRAPGPTASEKTWKRRLVLAGITGASPSISAVTSFPSRGKSVTAGGNWRFTDRSPYQMVPFWFCR